MTKHHKQNHHSKETKESQTNHGHNQGDSQENLQQQIYPNQVYSTDPRQLIPLWEQMGASTGGLIGRFIGLNFYAGASYLTNFLAANPGSNPYYANNFASLNPNPYMPETHATGTFNNQQSGYFVTIQTEADNAETVQNIIKENNGQI